MEFEHYIQQGQQKLRCGYTTGTCAALAGKAAVRMLLGGQKTEEISVLTPKGLWVTTAVEEIQSGDGWVSCGVRKDAGDDIDVTAQSLICVRAKKTAGTKIVIDGGVGVGRVTKPGLEQPVGAAAINSVPRRMILQEAEAECLDAGYEGGLLLTVFVPDGEALAKKTFNPQLGIQGGISILGTTGIVEPKSVQALVDTIGLEIRQRKGIGGRCTFTDTGQLRHGIFKGSTGICLHDAGTVFQLYRGSLRFCSQQRIFKGHIGGAHRQACQAGGWYYEYAFQGCRLPV